MRPEIIFPKINATDINAAMDQLFEIFHDHYPFELRDNGSEWILGLKWPDDPRWFIDPDVVPTAESLFNLSPQEIVPFYRVSRVSDTVILMSMFHSRALIAASMAMQQQSRTFSCIIHIDDHSDLMPVPLTYDAESHTLLDAIFGSTIRINDPDAIEQAIDRGLISKGNFLTAYVISNAPGLLIHVAERLDDEDRWLMPTVSSTPLGDRQIIRTGVAVESTNAPLAWRLQRRNRLPFQLPETIDRDIWLDIDLDAFCNRYNGDSAFRMKVATPVELADTKSKIARLVNDLEHVPWLKNVRAVSIAVSPAFFPSEYWSDTLDTIQRTLTRQLARP